jgi:hypothetical protein
MNDEPSVVEMSGDPYRAGIELQRLADLGYVVDLMLQDGTVTSGVLVGVSSTGLILDRWDGEQHCPVGDPIVIDLSEVQRVIVP